MTVGMINKFSIVDEAIPPMIILAIGPIISLPALSLSKAMGNMANAITGEFTLSLLFFY